MRCGTQALCLALHGRQQAFWHASASVPGVHRCTKHKAELGAACQHICEVPSLDAVVLHISDKQWVCTVGCRARVLPGCATAAWSCDAEMRPCWASHGFTLHTCIGQAAAVQQLIELREEVDNVIWAGEAPQLLHQHGWHRPDCLRACQTVLSARDTMVLTRPFSRLSINAHTIALSSWDLTYLDCSGCVSQSSGP